jgi:hypothetical protein
MTLDSTLSSQSCTFDTYKKLTQIAIVKQHTTPYAPQQNFFYSQGLCSILEHHRRGLAGPRRVVIAD